jgi:biopolymer transport protein ExbB/TolQ
MDQIVPSLTPIGLFFQAGPVAKTVLLTLLAASVWCWVLIIEAVWCIRLLNRAARAARVDDLDPATELLYPIVAGTSRPRRAEPRRNRRRARTRVTDSMRSAAQSLLMRLEGGLPNLAVISSVAPFHRAHHRRQGRQALCRMRRGRTYRARGGGA